MKVPPLPRGVIAPQHSTDRFTYTSSGAFVAEASDFGPNARIWGQLYNDAADIGLVLISAKSGARIAFYLDEERKDREGEITEWAFKAVDAKVPYRVVIFND